MKVAVFSTKSYEIDSLKQAIDSEHELLFFQNQLRQETAKLADGCQAVIAFVNDLLDDACLTALKKHGVAFIALRSAGYNHVDLDAAQKLGIKVARVPAYSPYAVAEHTLALLLAVNRHIHKAYARVRENNFSLNGLMGFDLHGKCIGIIGTGKIGEVFCRLLSGFGCELIAFDPFPNPKLVATGIQYVSLPELWSRAHVISLHCPLTPETYHLINNESLSLCRDGVVLINTSRGALVDTQALIDHLKTKKLGAVALDVYEEEAGIFFEDLSDQVVTDDVLMRLMTFPNVLITSHQAFFTKEALSNIAQTTADNLDAFQHALPLINEVKVSY